MPSLATLPRPDTTTIEGCVTRANQLGCELVSTRHVGGRSPGRVVLCHRTGDDTWITWRTFDEGAGGFHHGHYDMTEEEARGDMIDRG